MGAEEVVRAAVTDALDRVEQAVEHAVAPTGDFRAINAIDEVRALLLPDVPAPVSWKEQAAAARKAFFEEQVRATLEAWRKATTEWYRRSGLTGAEADASHAALEEAYLEKWDTLLKKVKGG